MLKNRLIYDCTLPAIKHGRFSVLCHITPLMWTETKMDYSILFPVKILNILPCLGSQKKFRVPSLKPLEINSPMAQ